MYKYDFILQIIKDNDLLYIRLGKRIYMIKNILIVEDDIQQRTNLKRILNEYDKDLNIYEAESEKEALEIIGKVAIDIFYVDVSLKDSSGIEFAKKLRKIKNYELSWIVFLTTHVQYMLEAFKEIHCYDYIIKPYEKEDIIELTKKLILGSKRNSVEEIERKSVVFDLKNGISLKVYLKDFYFIEVNLRTCNIHTKSGKYEASGLSIKKILDLIDCEFIVQSFRSFVVNTKNIEKIEVINKKLSEIYFEGYSEKALLSYKFKDEILERFAAQ